jgi:hypothetical protein
MTSGFVDCKVGTWGFWCRWVITMEEGQEVGGRWIFEVRIESEKRTTDVDRCLAKCD